jgi:hypothetical protein
MNLISSGKGRFLCLGIAVIIAAVHDLLFWQAEIGINIVVFVLLYSILLVGVAAKTQCLKQKMALFLLLPVLLLACDMVFFSNEFVQHAGILGMIVLSLGMALLLTLRNPHKHLFSFWAIPIIRNPFFLIQKWLQVFQDLFALRAARKNTVSVRILYGVLVAVPILLIFGALFYQADAVFAHVLNNLFHIEIDSSVIGRIIRAIILTVFLGGIFYACCDEKHLLGEWVERQQKEDSVIAMTVLALLNILFLVFIIIQFTYLFGSKQVVLENGITFAEYARSGFFQLVWVIILAVALILLFYRLQTHKMHGMVQVMSVFLLAQVAVIALSALKRMNLYQTEYGFTVLRLYVEWFIYGALIFLVALVAAIIMRVQYRHVWYGGMIAALLLFVFVSSRNVDRMIARENISRYFIQHKDVDLLYLSTLSTDVMPEMVPFLDGGWRQLPVEQKWYFNKILEKYIQEKQKRNSWQEFHIGFDWTTNALANYSVEGVLSDLNGVVETN